MSQPQRLEKQPANDLAFVGAILAGDEDATRRLQPTYNDFLLNTLRAQGASTSEAEDILADLWSDCFGGNPRRDSILNKYRGRCALGSWLAIVAKHRLYDLKRSQRCHVNMGDIYDETRGGASSQLSAQCLPALDSSLIALLRRAIQLAFLKCDAEALLMLKLVHLHKITQRELLRLWYGVTPAKHESSLSRKLDSARTTIRDAVMLELKQTDPLLNLKWEDLTELCRCSDDFLDAGSQSWLQDRTVHASKKNRENERTTRSAGTI